MPRSRKNRGPFDPYEVYRNSGWDWFKNPDYDAVQARKKMKSPKEKRVECKENEIVGQKMHPEAMVLFRVHRFKCPCGDPYWSEWDSPLNGADEGQFCENPKCKHRDILLPYCAVISPTPCAFSTEKYFGEFRCQKCGKFWTSANAWVGKYQICSRCPTKVYPFNMEEHEKYDIVKEGQSGEYFHVNRRTSTPHLRELCQMCTQIKGNCADLPRIEKFDITATRFYRVPPRVRETATDDVFNESEMNKLIEKLKLNEQRNQPNSNEKSEPKPTTKENQLITDKPEPTEKENPVTKNLESIEKKKPAPKELESILKKYPVTKKQKPTEKKNPVTNKSQPTEKKNQTFKKPETMNKFSGRQGIIPKKQKVRFSVDPFTASDMLDKSKLSMELIDNLLKNLKIRSSSPN